ncbi:ATP-binding protein [Pseudomonas plecoglossicida]|uniref:ATP-binding protein n=1 Tax=Pseudomonas plecoglossicida TaxID=70775 RepID=UPI0015E3E94D|nr:ATP-binding protein [Pseudomonas plecoglossicida]MBA1321795.1 response regulator [Pseudomonas plecoglossicida]
MKSDQDNHPDQTNPPFLLGGGIVSSLIQTMDWSGSPLGAPQQWSSTLKTLVATILPAQAQIVLFWGPEYVALYNDAYTPTIGAKHPLALGRPAQENWTELWDDLEPLLSGVRNTGQTFSAKDRPFYIERSGYGETAYFDVSYSAVHEIDGTVGGVLCIVAETTERVQFERRQSFLLELGQALPELNEPEQIEAYAIERVGQQLGAARVFLAEAQGDDLQVRIARDWVNGASSRTGELRYADIAAQLPEQLGRSFVVTAAETASVYVPVLRGNRLEAMLGVEFAQPHFIDKDQCLLLEDTAKRVWQAITHARSERALRASSAHLEATFAELMALNECLEERVSSMLAEREEANRQLHEAGKMEMIGQLTGGIAHDFNNMLTPIIASLELIRRHPEDAKRSVRLIDGALQAADRARILVGRLLSFARRQTLKPQAVCLATLVDEMHELMARSLGPTIEVVVQIDPQLPNVLVDPHQLELALLNLVINARDAMSNGGRVYLAAGVGEDDPTWPENVHGRQVWLQVRDSGCGMSQEVLGRCFEPFYSTKQVGKGTGLGLPMVQGLAAQSGGGFAIKSQPGQGTQATLWLPVSRGQVSEPLAEGAEDIMAQGPLQVLLVDDEDIVRNATALQLRDLGYQVAEAASPARARQLLAEGLVMDVLVTDQIMADETGAEFAQQLRQQHPYLPVLIITGYANLTPRELNGFAVLRKPFRRAELAESLAQLLALNSPLTEPPEASTG